MQGYNATVLAYGQTGSGKTHTMSGGVGIRGIAEEGITCRVANHVFAILDVIRTKQKPGDKIQVGGGLLARRCCWRVLMPGAEMCSMGAWCVLMCAGAGSDAASVRACSAGNAALVWQRGRCS